MILNNADKVVDLLEIIAAKDKQIQDMQERLDKAFILANNAMYFNDRSDYLGALYDVCECIKPEIETDKMGIKYMGDSIERTE